jgi:histone H4
MWTIIYIEAVSDADTIYRYLRSGFKFVTSQGNQGWREGPYEIVEMDTIEEMVGMDTTQSEKAKMRALAALTVRANESTDYSGVLIESRHVRRKNNIILNHLYGEDVATEIDAFRSVWDTFKTHGVDMEGKKKTMPAFNVGRDFNVGRNIRNEIITGKYDLLAAKSGNGEVWMMAYEHKGVSQCILSQPLIGSKKVRKEQLVEDFGIKCGPLENQFVDDAGEVVSNHANVGERSAQYIKDLTLPTNIYVVKTEDGSKVAAVTEWKDEDDKYKWEHVDRRVFEIVLVCGTGGGTIKWIKNFLITGSSAIAAPGGHGGHGGHGGRGKGGMGLGKGGAKRHRKVLRDNIQGVTKPAIRRLARRGGVKRISGLIYEETRGVLKKQMENIIRDSVTYTEHARRKTVTAMDVVHALKRQGHTMYGFGG